MSALEMVGAECMIMKQKYILLEAFGFLLPDCYHFSPPDPRIKSAIDWTDLMKEC